MTPEEMQELILKQQTDIANMQTVIDTKTTELEQATTKITESETLTENLNKDITSLKEKNMDLFLRVAQPPQPIETPPKVKPSLDDIINKIGEK